MYIKSFPLPVILAGVYDNEVKEPQKYADQLTAIYTEIDLNGGEVIAKPKLAVVISGRSPAIASMPVIVVKFPGSPTNVGTD